MEQADSINWGFILYNLFCVLPPLILTIYFGNKVYKLNRKARENEPSLLQQEAFSLFQQLSSKQQLAVFKYIEQQTDIAKNSNKNFEFEEWRDELLLTGNFSDDSNKPEDLYKWDRYLELLEMVEGNHEQRIFESLIDSLQSDYDNGLYQVTIEILLSYPPELFGRYLVTALPDLIQRLPDKAGDFLSIMINDAKSFKKEHSRLVLQRKVAL